MKNIIVMAALICSACIISSCGGDRVPKSGTDTVKSTYGNTPDSSKLDTGKATGMDNSGSGGTKIDSTKNDTAKK